MTREAFEVSNIYAEDANQLDLIKNISSMELLAISEQFDYYPGEELDLAQFVKVMKEVMHDNVLCKREDFIQQLVDLFYRSNKTNAPTIKFQDLTSYLIEHEIEHYTTNATQVDMQYMESTEIVDKGGHNGYIEKMYYFQQIDKVILFEQNGRVVKIYDAPKMKPLPEASIECSGPVLAIEFIADRNAIAVSLADLTIRFYEWQNNSNPRF